LLARFSPALKVFAIVSATVLLAALAAVSWLTLSPRRVPSGQPPLETLSAGSVAAFRSAFNGSDGSVRVLVMLSPT
jgi:hypothetical protein